MVLAMIRRDPAGRPPAAECLQVGPAWHGTYCTLAGVPVWPVACTELSCVCCGSCSVRGMPVMPCPVIPLPPWAPPPPQSLCSLALPPEVDSVVRPFLSSMLHLDSDARVALVNEEYAHLRRRLVGGGPPEPGTAGEQLSRP